MIKIPCYFSFELSTYTRHFTQCSIGDLKKCKHSIDFLKNIGRAIDSVANDKVAAWYNDKRGIILAIQKQPNTNTLEVASSIKKILPLLRNQILTKRSIKFTFL